MAQVEWCAECKRMVDISCVCEVPFGERVKTVSFETGSWAPNTKAFQVPENYPKGGKLSPHRPK